MTEPRPQPRFRLPWFSAPPPPRPATEPQPTSQSNAPPRPPFRPAGVAPAQPQPSDQSSSSRASTQPRGTAPSVPSSRSIGPRAVSQPAATPSRTVASQAASPSRPTTQSQSQLPPSRLPSQPTGSRSTKPSSSLTKPTANPQSSPKKETISGKDSQLPTISFNPPAGTSKTSKPSSPPQEQPKKIAPSPSKKPPTIQEKSQSPVVPVKQAPTIQEKSQSPVVPVKQAPSIQEKSHSPVAPVKQAPTNQEKPQSLVVSDKQTPTIPEKSQSAVVSDKQAPSLPQKEAIKKEGRQPTSQEAQPKAGIVRELAEGFQLTPPSKKNIQSDVTKPSQIPGPSTAAAPKSAAVATTGTEAVDKNSESSTRAGHGTYLPEPEGKLGEEKEVKTIQEGKTLQEEKRVPEAIREGSAHGEPPQKEIHELPKLLSGNRIKPKAHPLAHASLEDQQKQDQKKGNFDKKDVITTHSTREKTVETVIPAYPKVSKPQKIPDMTTGEKAHLQREIKEDVSKFMNKLGVAQAKQPLDEVKSISIITLAGENRGASMVVGSESERRDGSIRIHRGYKTNQDENTEVTDGEDTSKGRKDQAKNDKEDMQTKAYMNSNVQSVNNSLVFNSSVSERNPGIHYSLSRHPTEPGQLRRETGTSEARKAEYNVIPAENLTYSPTIRRRCLQGLFVESSDSNEDNPKKP